MMGFSFTPFFLYNNVSVALSPSFYTNKPLKYFPMVRAIRARKFQKLRSFLSRASIMYMYKIMYYRSYCIHISKPLYSFYVYFEFREQLTAIMYTCTLQGAFEGSEKWTVFVFAWTCASHFENPAFGYTLTKWNIRLHLKVNCILDLYSKLEQCKCNKMLFLYYRNTNNGPVRDLSARTSAYMCA